MKLKCAYGIAPGVSVSEQETERQDKIKIFKEKGISGISFAANAAALVIAERFEEFYSSRDDVVRKDVLEAETKASGSGDSLLFVAVKKNRYLAGHMGGGLIAVLNDGCSILSKPETKDRKQADLGIFRGELQEPFGFMLLSDGACLSLYESDTGNLSPACGTFFEWLKEYDEETVSGALADNIDKYFLKETNCDICVAVMVTGEGDDTEDDIVEDVTTEDEQTAAPPEEDELDAEPAEPDEEESEPAEESEPVDVCEPIEASKPVREIAKSSNYIKYLIAVALVVILAVVVVLTTGRPGDTDQKDQGKAKANPPAALSDNSKPAAPAGDSKPAAPSETAEPGVSFAVDNPQSYDAGTYQVGEDIPAGEYFFWNGEMLKPDSVKVNDFTCLSGALYCLTVQVNEGDTLTSDYRFTAAENVNRVVAGNGVLISGKYKIGKDIAPGTYKISPLDQNAKGKYYSILNGEISNDETFSGETTVNVPEEGYIVFYNSALTVK